MLSYQSTRGHGYQVRIYAARLVAETGLAGLPSPFGEVDLETLHDDPQRYGFPKVHPLQELYPSLVVQYYLMVLYEHMKVERNRVKGVSLYADYTGSGVSAEITSEMGRNAVAPWSWEGEPGSPTDPTATGTLEWRRVSEDNFTGVWQNHMVHGVPPTNLDWRDGVPTSLRYMHDPHRGEVLQSILVPKKIPGLGNAEQTIPADALRDTYSILLWFPKSEYNSLVRRAVGHDYDHFRDGGVLESYKGPMTFGGGVMKGDSMRGGYEPESLSVERSATPKAEFKMSSGGRIRQHIIPNPFGPYVWEDKPEVLFVCIPVGEEQADRLTRANMPKGRKTF